MLTIQNLLKNVYCSIKNISKKSYRNCAVLVSGFSVFAMVSLNAHGFGGAGKNRSVVCSSVTGTEGEAPAENSEQESESSLGDSAASGRQAIESEQESGVSLGGSAASGRQAIESEQESGAPLGGFAASGRQATESEQESVAAVGDFASSCKQAIESEHSRIKEEAKAEKQKREVTAVCASVEPVQNEMQRPPVNPYGDIPITEEDYEALLRIVQAEAGGEDEQGKILVAEVILNRVLAKDFASTVSDVIFEKSGGSPQFAPTADGRYYSVEVTGSTVEAVEKAIHEEDISQGALFFSARRRANPYDMAWFDRNLTWLFQYGGHEFYTLP